MPSVLGVPLDAAYHLVAALATALTPVTGGLAAAAAIVVFTIAVRLLLMPLSYRVMRGLDAQARIAPKVQVLRQQHAKQPDRLQRELASLYQAEGVSMYAGCLPLLLQWPFLSVMYLLFRSASIDGAPNGLLTHGLFGAPLASHWLTTPGPFSLHGAVFAGLFVLLGVIGWLSARLARRLTSTASLPLAGVTRPTGDQPGGGTADLVARSTSVMSRLTPYLTMVFAAFLPLAAGLYLATTTAWTLGERLILGRRMARAATGR
jgi:YidC/Oxa1 family membrane protein insertase